MNPRVIPLLLALFLMAATPAIAPAAPAAETKATAAAAKSETDAARARALKDGWPDTPAGLFASGWVEAFSIGEKAMQAFLESHLSQESLAKKPMSERLDSYRSAHDRLGALTLVSVDKSEPAELTVVLLGEDAKRYPFAFKVQPKAPHYLVSINMTDTRHGGHGH